MRSWKTGYSSTLDFWQYSVYFTYTLPSTVRWHWHCLVAWGWRWISHKTGYEMNIAIFITVWTAVATTSEVDTYFRDLPLAWLKSSPAVELVEFYTPASGRLSMMYESGAPAMMIEVNTDSIEKAKELVYSGEFKKLFTSKRLYPFAVEKINVEILEVVNYKLPGHETPPVRTAPLSFVVRYYGPVKNHSGYVDYYTNHHPALLAKFPGIRNVLCYLPVNWQSSEQVTDSRLLIGNEVVFDDLAGLEAALHSPVMDEVSKDGKQLAKFNIGDGTHHAMEREQVYKR